MRRSGPPRHNKHDRLDHYNLIIFVFFFRIYDGMRASGYYFECSCFLCLVIGYDGCLRFYFSVIEQVLIGDLSCFA